MNARAALGVAVGLFVGLWIGRALPQADLRAARTEVAELKRNATRPPAGRAALSGVESMLQVRREEVAEARRARQSNTGAVASASAPRAAPAHTNAHAAAGNLSNEIERVRQAWDLRRDIARRNFLERAKLNERQAADFDVVIEGMNLRLGAAIDQWAERIRGANEFTAETGVRMMNDLSEAVVLTYDELDRKLPAEWRQQAGPRFELVRFVDPEVLTPMQDLEDIMSRADFGEPGRQDDPPEHAVRVHAGAP